MGKVAREIGRVGEQIIKQTERSGKDVIHAIEKVGKEIGRLVGVYSHDETFSDIQITNLLTVGAAEKSARSSIIRDSGGDSVAYSRALKTFQRDYRKKYSAQFLTSLGYAPSTTAQTLVLNEPSVLSYIQGFTPTASEIISLYSGFITYTQAAFWYLQENFNWTNHTATLIESGKTWINPEITNGGSLSILLTREYVETITENLTDNYSYNVGNDTVTLNTGPTTMDLSGTALPATLETVVEIRDSGTALVETQVFDTSVTKAWAFTSGAHGNDTYEITVLEDTVQTDQYNEVIDNTELYDVPPFSSNEYDNGGVPSYKTTVTRQSDSSPVDIYTAIETVTKIAPDIEYEVMYSTYKRSDFSASHWLSYVEDITTVPGGLYVSDTVDMTAIIPLKENNIIVNLADYQLKRMLSKLNLNPDQLVDSLGDSNMDNAYLITGIHPGTDIEAGYKALYQSFDFYAAGSGSITISMSQLSMRYQFVIDKQTLSGQVQPVGTYTKVITGSGASAVMTMIFQGSTTQYKKIVISEYSQTYTISGQVIVTNLTGDEKHSRVIIPLQILNGLRYREFVEVYENSLAMLAFSVETVRIKWYETGAFGMLMKIVSFVIIIATFVPSGGTSVTWGSVLTAAFEGLVISQLIKLAIKVLGPELGVIATIAGAIALAYAGDFSSASNLSVYLPHATAVLQSMNQAIAIKTEELIISGRETINSIESELAIIKDKLDELRDKSDAAIMIGTFSDSYASDSPNGDISPDTYIALMQGASAFDYDQYYNVDGEINRRKVVAT